MLRNLTGSKPVCKSPYSPGNSIQAREVSRANKQKHHSFNGNLSGFSSILCRYQYHPPGLTPGPLIFSVKIPAPRTAFQCRTSAPGSKKKTKIPTPGHNLPSSNAKISMKKEHYSIKAVSFQIFHNCPFHNFLLS